MSATAHRRRIAATRHALLITSALIGCAGAATEALAQEAGAPTLPAIRALPRPIVGNESQIKVSPDGLSGKVDLDGADRVFTWRTFDVGDGHTLSFVDNTNTASPAVHLTAINRLIVGAPQSVILGAIKATNIDVWLINPDGITFGPKGSFSGGGLVLSTLPDVPSSVGTNRFAGLSTAPITFLGGSGLGGSGKIVADGSIVAVAQRIDTAKSVTATGSVALVAATDVTFTDGVDNPLSIRINAGTTIGTAQIRANGAISGQSIRIAGGADAAIQGALLGVTVGGTLTATNVGGAIVIATRSTTAAGGSTVTLAKRAVAASTIDVEGGSLGATTDADVLVNGTGTVTIGGTTKGRDVSFTAGGALTASGNVTASRDYRATGATVTLGDEAKSITQTAGGTVAVAARTGGIRGLGDLTLRSGQAGAGTLTLDAADTIAFSPDSTLIAGTQGTRSDVLLASSGKIALGAVRARALLGLGRSDDSLRTAADFSSGALDLDRALDIRANAGTITIAGPVTVGDPGAAIGLRGASVAATALKTNGGDILVSAKNDATIAGASKGADVTFTARGTLTASGHVSATGDYRATAAAVLLGDTLSPLTQSAGGLVAITAKSGDITGRGTLTLKSGQAGTGTLTLASAGVIALSPSSTLVAGTPAARSNLLLRSGGDIALGTVSAKALTEIGSADDSLTVRGDFRSGSIALVDALDLGAVGTIGITGDVTSATNGAAVGLRGSSVAVTGTIGTSGGDILIAADRDVTLGSVTTLRAGATGGTIAVAARGMVTVAGRVDAGEDIAVRAGGSADLEQLDAGDDVVIDVGRTLKLSGITTDGAGADDRAVLFGTGPAGRPTIAFGAETVDLAGSTIALTATRILSKPPLSGSAHPGLIVDDLTANGAAVSLSAASGDIRIGSARSDGTLDVLADAGSITGLGQNWTPPSGGSTLTSAGAVRIDARTVAIGAIDAKGDVRSVGAAKSIRVGTVKGADIALGATYSLQLGTVAATGSVSLATTGGPAQTVDVIGKTLVHHYGDAHLVAGSRLTVGGGAAGLDGAAGGVAQLGTVSGDGIDVRAQAVNVGGSATATGGDLFVRADAGRLAVQAGEAKAGGITLWKRGTVGLLRGEGTAGLRAGNGIDLRSTTGARVTTATATTGNLAVQSAGNVRLTNATANAGTLALLAGGRVTATGSLSAAQDVAVRAGVARLNVVTAGDDVDFKIDDRLALSGAVTTLGAGGGDTGGVVFDTAAAGQSDPAGAFPDGGIAVLAPDPLVGSTIRIQAGTIAGGPASSVRDGGLVIGTLIGTSATITAQRGDVRIGEAEATSGDLTVRAGGSVSGLRAGWAGATGVTLDSAGDVRLDVSGRVTLGTVKGRDVFATGGAHLVEIGALEARNATLSASQALQLGTATLSGSADLQTTAGAARAIDPAGQTLVAGHGDAVLTAAGLLTIGGTAARRDGGAGGAAQLADISGAGIDIRARAVTIGSATATGGAIFVRADAGQLTVARETAASDGVTLWKRGAIGDLTAGPIVAGNGVDVRSATDATVRTATAKTGALAVQAARNVTLNDGIASAGTLALLAGDTITASGTLFASDDVAARASAGAMTLGAVDAGDDIDLFAGGTLTFASLIARATGKGMNSGVTFVPGAVGRGVASAAIPATLSGGGIAFGGADTLAGSSVRIRAGTVGQTPVGPDGALVVGRLTGTAATITARTGDIRLGGVASDDGANGFVKTAGDLTVVADRGSVTGLADGWADSSGTSSIQALGGAVSIRSSGSVAIGTIRASGDVTGGANVTGTRPAGMIRIGSVEAANLKLTAKTGLEVGTATLTGTASLRTTGGAAQGVGLAATTLAPGYGRAALEASDGALTISALKGAAQLGTIAAGSIDVRADALDVSTATATGTDLFLLAERGRLTLGTGMAATTATLTKRDDDAAAGTPARTADALFVDTLNAGTGIDVRSATDATVTLASTTAGDLTVQAARNVTLTDGTASKGTLAMLAGGAVTSTGTLAAAEDVAAYASGNATFGTVTAGDDVDLFAGGTLFLRNAKSDGSDVDPHSVTFTPTRAGLGDPTTAASGGIAIGVGDALAGSTIRLRAGAITGPALAGSVDAGLVVEKLTSGDRANVSAGSGDIRVGSATVSTGGLDVTAAAGSITGLRDGWTASSGGSSLVTPGRVIIESTGAVSIGSVKAGGAVTGAGTSHGGVMAAARLGAISAASLDLAAGSSLQVGSADIGGVASLRIATGASSPVGSTASALAPGYGAAALAASSGPLTVSALAGVAQLGALTGTSIDVRANAIGIASASATETSLILLAESGRLTLGVGKAGTTAMLTKLGGGLESSQSDALSAGSVTAGRGITIASATDVALGTATTSAGDIVIEAFRGITLGTADSSADPEAALDPGGVNAPNGTVTLRNTGDGATAIGDGPTEAFALSNAEMTLINSGTVVIDSGSNIVRLGDLTIADATGSTSLKLLTTGAITLSGQIKGSGSGTLQIGGTDDPADQAVPAGLAKSIVAKTGDVDDGAGIDFANGAVDLRAERILFGSDGVRAGQAPLGSYLGLTNADVARLVADPASAAYTGNTTRETYLTAKTMTVSYSDFAIFQNTEFGVSTGVAIHPGSEVNDIVLQLFSTGDNRANSFSLFGQINGRVGQAAALLPNEVLNIADTTNGIRISRTNSRVNGCVIGAPEKGCVNADLPAVQFRLYDERQTQLFTSSADPSIYANPLIGRGNEGLIVDIADVPVGIDTIECPKDAPDCRKEGTPR